ncbi:MAG TPA: methyltransferase domain-containing protein [bacterium]|nr:methyltransferase domain-containing protein [bacterium]
MSEQAWRGDFGNAYTKRNIPLLVERIKLWEKILPLAVRSICEVGSGAGANLEALSHLTNAELIGIEPNELARYSYGGLDGTAQNIPLKDDSVEFAFTCGVLIHIPPKDLGKACDEIYRISSKYIACIEYFSDEPESKPYRGYDSLLFKRDFGSYWLDRFPDLKVIDYGFFWKRMTGLDNLTYWIFEKETL